MDNMRLAHIGGDLLLIGGVAFYCHRRTARLNEEIAQLRKENEAMQDAIDDLQRTMQQLGAIVMQQRRPTQAQPVRPPMQSENILPINSDDNVINRVGKKHHRVKHVRKSVVAKDEDESSSDDSTVDAKELDAVVNEELNSLNKCAGDQCKATF